jgi:hypothetical protein
VQEPASLLDTVRAVRARVDGQPTNPQLAAMLNEIAWLHRAEGWGLSKKPGGHNCPTPPPAAVLIACDILHHKPTNLLYDVFGSVEAGATPQWGSVGPPLTPDREWLAPIAPSGTEPEPPPPTDDLKLVVAVLQARVLALEETVRRVDDTLVSMGQRVGALENGVPEDRVSALIDQAIASLRVTGRTERAFFGHSHQVELKVVR